MVGGAAPARAGAEVVHVAELAWPEEAAARHELAALGLPRLLVVPPGSAPPVCTTVLEDWVRVDAPVEDRVARRRALAEVWHRSGGSGPPTCDPAGRLWWRGRSVDLPATLVPLARRLTATPGRLVALPALRAGSPGRQRTGRRRLEELHRAVAPLGLRVLLQAPGSAVLEPMALSVCEGCEREDDDHRVVDGNPR